MREGEGGAGFGRDEDEGCVCSPAVSVMGVAGVELCRSDSSHQLVKKHREP